MMPIKHGKLNNTIRIAAMGIKDLVTFTLLQVTLIKIRMDISTRSGEVQQTLQLGFNRI
jgi:hypothetical protein